MHLLRGDCQHDAALEHAADLRRIDEPVPGLETGEPDHNTMEDVRGLVGENLSHAADLSATLVIHRHVVRQYQIRDGRAEVAHAADVTAMSDPVQIVRTKAEATGR
jgi:hypothetical protein